MSNDISNFSISPAINNRAQYNACGVGATDTLSQFNLGMYTSGELKTAGFSLQGANGLNINLNPVKTTRLWINELSSEVSFKVKSDEILTLESLTDDIQINSLTTFSSSCPQTSFIPTLPDDLVNLNYIQNNPPASAVIFYLNNSLTPSPPISTYALLGSQEDNLSQSFINTSISGIGTIQLIRSFSNQLINLNAGSFIPSGIWDLNVFSRAVLSSDIGHISLYFAIFGRTTGGIETQISTNSSQVPVGSIVIEQLKMTLAVPYTSLSGYSSLVIKLYTINDRTAQTDITTYYEGTTTYSHLHTTFGIYVPPSILGTNNLFTGVNTFSQNIIGNLTGTSSTTLSAPDSSLSNNVALKDGVNIFSNNNTFNNLISGSISGNSATSTTSSTTLSAPDSSLSSNVVFKDGINIFSNNNTFNNLISGSISGNSATSTTSSTTLLAPDSSLSNNVALKDGINIFSNNNTFNNLISGSISGNSATSTTSSTTLLAPDSSLSSNVALKDEVNIFSNNNTFNNLISGSISGNSATSTTSSTIALTSDNSTGTYFIPFSKTTSTTTNILYIDDVTGTLNYSPSVGLLNSPQFSTRQYYDVAQTLTNGLTINLLLGTLLVDTGTAAITVTLPILTAASNGLNINFQKTSSTNHNLTINAGAGNNLAAVASNIVNVVQVMTNNIYQQSYRFFNLVWYPY